MVVAAVRAELSALPDEIDDSKRLSESRRRELADLIRKRADISVGTAVITAGRIDEDESNMNTLTVDGQAEALAAVAVDGDRAVVDASDVDAERFERRVHRAVAECGPQIEIHAEHGADASDPAVAAASIIAKVERDRRMAVIDARYDEAVGSGYPSDPVTREFLQTYVHEHGVLPDEARASWATCREALTAAHQSELHEF